VTNAIRSIDTARVHRDPGNVREVREAEAAARTLGLEVVALNNRVLINALAVHTRPPTIYGFREPIEAGGLMSMGRAT
jgi:hypothetical protein